MSIAVERSDFDLELRKPGGSMRDYGIISEGAAGNGSKERREGKRAKKFIR